MEDGKAHCIAHFAQDDMWAALPLYLLASLWTSEASESASAHPVSDDFSFSIPPYLLATISSPSTCAFTDAPTASTTAASEETDLPGFEEWKRLQGSTEEPVPTSTPAEIISTTLPTPPVTTSRSKYNYASPDCGARVHSSSKLSQHASSVLHKSRDRYMLTPCKAGEHWVTIELCDEVRVEAIEVAVWEFFSGIVREVKISAGEEGSQVEVGTFIGKNVRGVQVSEILAELIRLSPYQPQRRFIGSFGSTFQLSTARNTIVRYRRSRSLG
jgi:hypothetical protein